jgi:tetratricopeptide (TPR) repeat protein
MKYQEAIDIIEAAFKNGAERQYDNLETLALAYCKSGRFEEALNSFQEAVNKVPPDNVNALRLIRKYFKNCKQKSASSEFP